MSKNYIFAICLGNPDRPNNITKLILHFFFLYYFFPLITFSENYTADSLAVRAILDSNGLTDINVDSVSDSANGRITILYLYGRNISTLPPDIGKLTELEELWLYMNYLTSVPDEIGKLTKLKILWLNNNQLNTLTPEIENCINLEDLALYSNSLQSIPSSIGNLVNLVFLMIEDNNLQHWPFKIVNLQKLNYLSFSNNNFTEVPPDLGKLSDLTELKMDNNNLTSLPQEIGNLTKLFSLKLSYNKLETLPDSIVKLKPEVICDLGYNNIDTENLSDEVITWADKYDPDWLSTQDVNIIIKDIGSFKQRDIYLSYYPKSVKIYCNLQNSERVVMKLYNTKGICVKTLIDAYKKEGQHVLTMQKYVIGTGLYYIMTYIGDKKSPVKAVIIK